MRRVICVVLALLGAPTALLALEGRVVQDGHPVADATVSIVGRPGSARTDHDGRFTWQPDPAPPFEVLVVLPGGQYATPVRVEAVEPGQVVTVALGPTLEESVVVTADAAPHIEAPPASAVTVLAREDIEQRHPQRLTDVLENIPGAGRIDEGQTVVPSLRGLARGRTLILVDGARVSAERRAGPSATFLDPFVLEGVEVSRGPGSVAYGSDALGGVIHARTRQAEPGSPLGVTFWGNLGAGLPERSAGAEVSRGLREGGVTFMARYRDVDDYRTPKGKVLNSGAMDRGLLARFQHEAGPGRLSFGLQADEGRNFGKPASDAGATRTSYPREDSDRLTASYEMDPLRWASRLAFTGFLGGYRLVTDRQSTNLTQRSDVRAKDFGLRAQAVIPAGKTRVEAGLDVNGRFDLEALGSEFGSTGSSQQASIEDASRIDLGLYTSAEATLAPRLRANGGLRADRVTTRNHGGFFGDFSTGNGALSGFASMTAALGREVALTGQVSRGFRDPTLSDRFFNGVTGRGFATGNPLLEPETSLQFDLALHFKVRRLRGDFYAYDYRIDDLIERYECESGCIPGGPPQFFFRNRGRARLRGIELELAGDLGAGVSLEIGAQTAWGRTLDDGTPVDDVPARVVTLVLRKSLDRAGAYAFGRAAVQGRDERWGPTEKLTPGFATFDLGAGWRVRRRHELRLVLRNLLDQDFPASADAAAVLAPGRSASLTLVARLK